MASWLDAFVQGREYGNTSTLSGLEAGAMGKYRQQSEQGQRQRAEQANRLTAADMELRRNIAQTQLNYDAQVDKEIADRERARLDLLAAQNAANIEANRISSRQLELDLAKSQSMRNLDMSLRDPNATASDILLAMGQAGLQNISPYIDQIRPVFAGKLGGDVIVRDGNAWRFVFPEDGMIDLGGNTRMSARDLRAQLETLGIIANTLYDNNERRPPRSSGFTVDGRPVWDMAPL